MFIVDALFAVYEASSLELWSFMQYNGLNGAPRSYLTTIFYYITMVFYLVIVVQVRMMEGEEEEDLLVVHVINTVLIHYL